MTEMILTTAWDAIGNMFLLTSIYQLFNLKNKKIKMELKTAIEILEYHQEWRLGKREDMIHEPKKLTQALDIVLNEVKKLEASVSGILHPDIEKLLRYAVKQWSSLNEQSEPDHEDLVQYWLDGDCKEWIQSNYR